MFSCCQSDTKGVSDNNIMYGEATLKIEFAPSVPDHIANLPIEVIVKNKLLGEYTIMNLTREEGARTISVDIPVWYITLGHCLFSTGDTSIDRPYYLIPDKCTTVRLSISDTGEFVTDVEMPLQITTEDITKSIDAIGTSIRLDYPENIPDMEIARLRILNAQDYINSKKELTPFQHAITLGATNAWLFTELYSSLTPGLTELDILETFDLNNTMYLYNSHEYFTLLNYLLHTYSNELTPIGETKPEIWIADMDAKIGGWVDHKNGFFYDMLVMTNYARQLAYQSTPFSDSQTANIKAFFKNEACARVLLEENEKLIARNELNAKYNITSTAHSAPDVPQKDLMSSILTGYSGNVVFVDFWTTWCSPCLSGIRAIKQTKESFFGREVKFVYLTDESSPLYAYNKAIATIPGEHYRLTKEDFKYLLNYYFNRNSFPNYLVFDKNGKLVKKITYEEFDPKSIGLLIESLL